MRKMAILALVTFILACLAHVAFLAYQALWLEKFDVQVFKQIAEEAKK